jgi:hypothetical protein
MTDEYATNKRNKVRQLREKARYDKETVHQVLDAGLVAHVALIEDGNPVVVPMIYGREGETIFLHGARKARVIRMLEENDSVCINVTLVDGIVLARSAFNSSMNYRSATVFGAARLLESDADKLHAMKMISEHLMPGRWDELRDPLDKEVKMTGVLVVAIDSASAKISSGMPADEPGDYDIPIWAGVLPLTSQLQKLQDDDRLLPDVQPSDVVLALQNRKI